jgi:anti-anti-sigma factor
MLTVKNERAGDVSVIKCAGRIVKCARVIVLDLSEVEALDAGGLNLLVSLHRWTESNKIHFKLVNPRPFVHEMLTRTHLDCVFDISTFNHALAVLGCDCHQAHAVA